MPRARLGIAVLSTAFALTACGGASYKVPSGSMEPNYPINSSITSDTGAYQHAAPKLLDVVTFHPPVGASNVTCASGAQGISTATPCDVAGREDPSALFLKRVVGLPGDRLRISDGAVYRNGTRETGVKLVACTQAAENGCSFPHVITVPAGDYYLLGDNRPDSDDSRFFGPIPRGWITGRVANGPS